MSSMKPKKGEIWTRSVEVYRTTVVLFFGTSFNAVKEHLLNNHVEKEDVDYLLTQFQEKGCGARTVSMNNMIFCYFKEYDSQTIVHELFHATHFILSERGVTLDMAGEAYAYLLGYLVNDLL